jgi:hypothetical protein
MELSPLCSRSRSEDNILYPLAKRPNRKSFIEILESVSDDAKDPEKVRARQMQQKKTHLAKSMLELRCRRVLPMLMRRKKIIKAGKSKPKADMNANGKNLNELMIKVIGDNIAVILFLMFGVATLLSSSWHNQLHATEVLFSFCIKCISLTCPIPLCISR